MSSWPNGVTKFAVKHSGSGNPSIDECHPKVAANLTWQCGSVSAKAAARGVGSLVFEAGEVDSRGFKGTVGFGEHRACGIVPAGPVLRGSNDATQLRGANCP